MHIPFLDDKNPNRWRCSNCGSAVAKVWNFCQHCGEMIDWNEKKGVNMENDDIQKVGEVHGDVFVKFRYESSEEQNDTDNKLGFEDLCNYIGTPVFVIYPKKNISDTCCGVIEVSALHAEKCQWEIVAGVKKTEAHEYVLFRGQNDWLYIDKLSIYPNAEVANESA